MVELIGLDFETYSATDLRTHGLDRYASDRTFQPLIGSVCYESPRGYRLKETHHLWNDNKPAAVTALQNKIGDKFICAHNAGFEQRVLAELGLNYPSNRFIDSAVLARACGFGSGLEAAAPQILNIDKMESGREGIMTFCVPGPYQVDGSPYWDPAIIHDYPQRWLEFGDYCELDAELSFAIVIKLLSWVTEKEWKEYTRITMDMNQQGWPVDVASVEEMQRRYLENQAAALEEFRARNGATDLNLNSQPQQVKWCAERGVRARSFDEKNVARLKHRLESKMFTMQFDAPKFEGYSQVLDLLRTKQVLGGSSLKKLKVILDTVGDDGRLRDQYLHCGAGQSWRTTGRSAQMQNLKRINETPDDMDTLFVDVRGHWTNAKLATNIRQVFWSSDKNGRLLVGDLKSVESRGLAYIAGAEWKLIAFRLERDMYKVMAEKIYGTPYDLVDKTQRQVGKVGELSCGYGAGPGAVVDFAEGMGVTLTHGEATKLVWDWREANPEIVHLWNELDHMLGQVMTRNGNTPMYVMPDGMTLKLSRCPTPESLINQRSDVQSIRMQVLNPDKSTFMVRYFHGCYYRGRDLCYYKPSDRKTGALWRDTFTNPKTHQVEHYKLYGGKLAGILTQSFCRELFMQCMQQVHKWAAFHSNVDLIGQFHDEIVVDWHPGGPATVGMPEAKRDLELLMSESGVAQSFPLGAEVKAAHRYIK